MRVVFDTNVYISALMFGGLPGALLNLAFLQSFTLIVSPALLDELCEKLKFKFKLSAEDVALVRERLGKVAKIVYPDELLHVVKDDPDDNRVLECAIKGKANYIISGDRHLAKLGSYGGILIVNARTFLEALHGI